MQASATALSPPEFLVTKFALSFVDFKALAGAIE
jgi:hypothetical protein